MNLTLTLIIVLGYFGLLFVISRISGRNADDKTFFTANRNSPWYLVAFGMIGTSLSGVTFLSVPGTVGGSQWSYLQFILGNLAGYMAIAHILMPLYYRLNLTSIYEYLEERFGYWAYKTGAVFFLISRVIGASLRLYLVALVLQIAICDRIGVPFAATVAISIALIYLYTYKGGIKTVVWTDTLQTACMLIGAGITVWIIGEQLNWGIGDMINRISESAYSKTFFWEIAPGSNFFKQFLSGAFISIAMTGLDQDMMQKNLTCRSLKEAQKNVYGFSIAFLISNVLFLSLGALLYMYGNETGILVESFGDTNCPIRIKDAITGEMLCQPTDKLFPMLALNYLGPIAGAVFVLAVIAAAYSSADSALTALTTSFCIDILNFEKRNDEDKKRGTRMRVHLGFAILLFAVILIFYIASNDAVVWEIFRLAGYTYGPLLGLFAFGMFTKIKPKDKLIPAIAILAPVLTWLINYWTAKEGFQIGFMILIVNGLITILLLALTHIVPHRNKG